MAEQEVADAARGMKRFYKNAAVEAVAGGFAIALDGRPVRTPARAGLVVPGRGLAEALAEEWNGQGDRVEPRAMPLTGLANAAIDRVAPDPRAFARTLAAFGETDLLCYRADAPDGLVARQTAAWDPLLHWARRRFDVEFETVEGIMHRPQPARTVEQLGKAVAARNAFQLAALAPLVTISGSLILALALAEGETGPEQAWAAAIVDDGWSAEAWGADDPAAETLEARRREFETGYRFLRLVAAKPQTARRPGRRVRAAETSGR